jgi:hypothetical protein
MRYRIIEGFKIEGTPDLKYYAFDWDDNIVHMPTKIILKNDEGDDVLMSTKDFADYRHKIGKEDFDYNGETIVGFADKPLRNFGVMGDKQFVADVMNAETGPAFDDFREAVNNGSVFAIITARGHNPNTLKRAVYKYIINNFNGINKDEVVKNLRKYRDFVGEEDMSDEELIKSYLELNKYHPVTFGDEAGAVNPEEAKVEAMTGFENYIRAISKKLDQKLYLKKKIGNKLDLSKVSIGFSDDDPKNVEVMKKHFEKDPNTMVKVYSTAGGVKRRV